MSQRVGYEIDYEDPRAIYVNDIPKTRMAEYWYPYSVSTANYPIESCYKCGGSPLTLTELAKTRFRKVSCRDCIPADRPTMERWTAKTCEAGHMWLRDTPNARRCPYCSGEKVLEGFNDFSTRCGREAQKFLKITEDLRRVGYRSKDEIEWECLEGHRFLNTPRRMEFRLNYAKRRNLKTYRVCVVCSSASKPPSQPKDPFDSHPERLLHATLRRAFRVEPPEDRRDRFRSLVPNTPYRSTDSIFRWKTKVVFVEYDGAYWHREEEVFERDTRKTEAILKASSDHCVVRLRERPLPALKLKSSRVLQLSIDPAELPKVVPDLRKWLRGERAELALKSPETVGVSPQYRTSDLEHLQDLGANYCTCPNCVV